MNTDILVFFSVIAFLAVILYSAIHHDKFIKKRNKENKENYEEAIRLGNRPKALELGRIYYAALRSNGRPTIYDEQAITNDLSTMG